MYKVEQPPQCRAQLVLKSRRVIPRRLLDAAFAFQFPTWPAAANELVAQRQERGRRT